MGEPIPPPPFVPPTNAGFPCAVCWGTGKPFGDGETPDEIVIVVSGISKGPNWVPGDGEPIEGTFTIPQFTACDYRDPFFPLGGFRIAFLVENTSVLWRFDEITAYFAGVTANPCETIVSSVLVDHFQGGTARIYIPEIIGS